MARASFAFEFQSDNHTARKAYRTLGSEPECRAYRLRKRQTATPAHLP